MTIGQRLKLLALTVIVSLAIVLAYVPALLAINTTSQAYATDTHEVQIGDNVSGVTLTIQAYNYGGYNCTVFALGASDYISYTDDGSDYYWITGYGIFSDINTSGFCQEATYSGSIIVPTGAYVVSTYTSGIVVTYEGSLPASGYDVTYNSNGGSSVTGLTGVSGLPAELPTPTKTGHIFSGWYTDSALTVAAVPGAAISANTTLYAKWTAVYSITYDSNGGSSVAAQSQMTHLPSPLPTSTRADYALVGWYTDSALTVAAVPGAAISANTTLYAKWQDAYDVSYYIDIGSEVRCFGTLHNQIAINTNHVVGLSYALPVSTSITWYTDSALTVAAVPGATVTSDISLYAKQTITITFDTPSGSEVSPLTVQAPVRASDLPVATSLSLPFYAWGRSENTDYGYYVDDLLGANDYITSNCTLYALFTAYMYFDANGGETITPATMHPVLVGDDTTRYYKYFVSASDLPTPTKSGYAFLGWYLDEDLTVAYVGQYQTSLTTIFAKWQEAYTVSFDVDGGSACAPIIDVLALPAQLPTPTKANCTFLGWYPDAWGEGACYEGGESISANTTLYALWRYSDWTINFDANGGSSCSAITFDNDNNTATVPELPTPTKSGYAFLGWYRDAQLTQYLTEAGDAWHDSTSGSVTLYAKWRAAQVQFEYVIYYRDGNSMVHTVRYRTDSTNELAFPLSVGFLAEQEQGLFDGDTILSTAGIVSGQVPTDVDAIRFSEFDDWSVVGEDNTLGHLRTIAVLLLLDMRLYLSGYSIVGGDGALYTTEPSIYSDTTFELRLGCSPLVKLVVTTPSVLTNSGIATAENYYYGPWTANTQLILTGEPSQDYATFSGWSYTDGGEIIDQLPTVTEDITLFAVFDRQTVNLSLVDMSDDNEVLYAGQVLKGAYLKHIVKDYTDKEGYDFLGVKASAADEAHVKTKNLKLTENKTYYLDFEVHRSVGDKIGDFFSEKIWGAFPEWLKVIVIIVLVIFGVVILVRLGKFILRLVK